MRSISCFALVVATPCLLGAGAALAQEKTFFDAVEVKVASVEVVVEDRDGAKISGLTADDFQIFEDGKPQELAYFSAQENGETVISADSDPGIASLAPATERVHLAIFVDDVHLSPQNRNQVFARLKEYLDGSLQPTDLVLIARLADRLVIEQPFTADVAALEATLDRLASRSGAALQIEAEYRRLLRAIATTPLPEGDPERDPKLTNPRDPKPRVSLKDFGIVQARNQAQEILAFSEERRVRVLATVKALHTAIGSLAGLKGRKALVYLSDGLPVKAAAGLSEVWRGKYENWALKNGSRDLLAEMSRATSSSIEVQSQLDQLADEASEAKVAFYVLSPGTTVARGVGVAEMNGAGLGGVGLTNTANLSESFESESALLQLAETTGGRVLLRNTDIARLLDAVRTDFGSFYSLGYQPQVAAKDGNREITVKVRGRPDAKVRYTHQLGDEDPVDALRELTLSALYHGLADNPLAIQLDPKPNPAALGGDRFRVDLMVKVPFEKLLLLPEDDHHVGKLTLFVVVQDHKKQNLSSLNRVEVPIKIPNDKLAQVMGQTAALPLKLEMQGGPQRLAIGLRDHLARVSSTIEVDFEVPDAMAATALPEAPEAPAPPVNDGGA